MYTTIAKYLPLYRNDPAESRTEFETFDEAETNGYRNAALGPVTEVGIYGNDGKMVAHYRKLTNYWYVFRDKEGNFISREEYMEKQRLAVEKTSREEGFPIEVNASQEPWLVVVGGVTTEIDPDMIPWVDLAMDRMIRIKDMREDTGGEPVTEEIFVKAVNKKLQEIKEEVFKDRSDPIYRLSVLPSVLPPSLALRG